MLVYFLLAHDSAALSLSGTCRLHTPLFFIGNKETTVLSGIAGTPVSKKPSDKTTIHLAGKVLVQSFSLRKGHSILEQNFRIAEKSYLDFSERMTISI